MALINNLIGILQDLYTIEAKEYKRLKDEGRDNEIDYSMMRSTARGAYMAANGTYDGIEKGCMPYFNYLIYGNKEENNNYETPYSFEYEPYMIEFNHEVSYNEPIQQEVVYEEPVVEEESCDINELMSIVDILTNKISKVKKHIIHYISNYRPIMNQYTGDIDTVLIE